ncbi:MAG: CCA tRNA nucleotidyltransferase, partial [Candidatus Omnitrophota bacterium]|nr:CCA tRNA nucleotidyltransferase [Candidatus Omnitrophota bacterium]
MKNYLNQLDQTTRTFLKNIGREADRSKLRAYLVGGPVRDILFNKKNLDLDIVIEGDAIEFARHLAKLLKANVKIYREFGTATLLFPHRHVDLVTARREDYPHRGALPVVMPGTLRDDLGRRDFTINAMAIALNQGNLGMLIDPFAGQEDLKAKKIRVLHDQSFADDPTRLLRAVRFEQRLGFHVEPKTLGFWKMAMKQKFYHNVKPPRYFAEFKKILGEKIPLKPLKRLYQLKGLAFFKIALNPDWKALENVQASMNQTNGKGLRVQPGLIYLIALLGNVSDASKEKISQRFQLTREERTSLLQSTKALKALQCISQKSCSPSRVYRLLGGFSLATILFLRGKASSRSARQRISRFLTQDQHVKLNINGTQLKLLGFASSRRMG